MDIECNLQQLVLIWPIQVKKIIKEEGKEWAKHAEINFKRQTPPPLKICANRALMDPLNAELGASGQF